MPIPKPRDPKEIDPKRVELAKKVLTLALMLGREIKESILSPEGTTKEELQTLWLMILDVYKSVEPKLKDLPAARRALVSLTPAEVAILGEYSSQTLNVPWAAAEPMLGTMVDALVGLSAHLNRFPTIFEKTLAKVGPVLKEAAKKGADSLKLASANPENVLPVTPEAYAALGKAGIMPVKPKEKKAKADSGEQK